MDNEKARAVLRAAEQLFQEEESHGHPPMVNGGPKAIGEMLSLPPAEVLVLLRMLHRKSLIALVGFGPHITIARDPELLRLPTAVVTNGGKSAKLSKGRRISGPEEALEDEQPPEVEELLAYITQLERMVDELQEKADRAEQRRRNVVDARNQDKATASAELERAQARIRKLTGTVQALQKEADKVPELEQRLTEQQAHRTVLPQGLAETIARLTQ